MKTKILIATRNKNKFREIELIFRDLDRNEMFELISLEDVIEIPFNFEVIEDGNSYEENAVKKAVEYGSLASVLTLADDSGLEVDALSDRPGIYSARYGSQEKSEKCKKLLGELDNVLDENRKAKYVCVMALYNPADSKVEICRGEYSGKITTNMRGNTGFGFDPIFLDENLKMTLAEMDDNKKNKLSHRRRALEKCFNKLLNNK